MKISRFHELADKFDTFYVYFKRASDSRRVYMVATHNLDDPYIQDELKKAPGYIQKMIRNPKEGYVALYSYTQAANDSRGFRVLPASAITHLSMLSTELDKQSRDTRRFKRA